MEAQKWWDELPIQTKKNMVVKYLSLNRTIAFLTAKDINKMYEGEKKS